MGSYTDKPMTHLGKKARKLAELPRAERLHRIGLLIKSPGWHTLPLSAREEYLDMAIEEY